jgi:hypothetical protein
LAIIEERLTKRFRNVPGVTGDDIADWLSEAEEESDLIESDVVSNNNAILYLAYAIGCESIATDAARYFKYTDGEENVDKTNIFNNYTKLAKDARKNYRKYVRGQFGASQSHGGRMDER